MLEIQAMEELFQTTPTGWRGFVEAWLGFLEWRILLRVVASLALSIGLAAALAFHPRTARGPAISEIEAPKTLILYAVIGTIVAQVVVVLPAMAFVVFGIGGLLRFRTDIGAPGDTGLVILVTIVGIACGLNMFPLAVLGAAVGWGVLYVMQSVQHAVLVVSGVADERLLASLERHLEAIPAAGVTILASRVRPDRGRFTLTLRMDPALTREDVEARILAIPADLRGALEWQEG